MLTKADIERQVQQLDNYGLKRELIDSGYSHETSPNQIFFDSEPYLPEEEDIFFVGRGGASRGSDNWNRARRSRLVRIDRKTKPKPICPMARPNAS